MKMESDTYLLCISLLASLLLTLALVLWMGHQMAWWRVTRPAAPLPPGPSSFPVVGNLPQLALAGSGRHRYLARLARKHGPIFTLRLGSTPVLVASSPSLARAVLRTHDKTFAGRPPFPNARLLMGHEHGEKMVTLLPYGDEWRQTRKLYIHQLFTPHRIQRFQTDIVSAHIRRLAENHLVPACEAGIPVDLSASVHKLIEDIIWNIVLRHRPRSGSSLDADDSPTTTAPLALTHLIHQIASLLGAPLIGEFVPFLGFLDYQTKASMRKWKVLFDDFMGGIITDRQKDRVELAGEESAQDILDVLLLPENRLREGAIKVLIMELFVAGSETTSLTIVWAMSELLSNPRVARKLRDELDAVVGRSSERQMVEFSHIPRLPYLRAVVKETLRLHPPGPLLFPHMSVDVCRDLGGYVIPEGTRVLVNVWAIGRDPAVWKDPEVFAPERFLGDGPEGAMDVRGEHFEMLPFGAGRRACPGLSLGLPTIEVTLANLVHMFGDWDPVLPPGQRSLNMSDEFGGIVCTRADPLVAVPRKKAIVL